jgi:DNA (cytosine-5)-methyltransferase 1
VTGTRLTSVDLFCGAGGLTLGLQAAGIDCRLGADNWIAARDTFTANFARVPFTTADLGGLSGDDLVTLSGCKPDVVSGGPPCQGFSSAGRRSNGDPRNSLVSVFARLVVELRPRLVLFENVEGFLTAEGGARLFDLLDPLIAAGYRIHLRKVNAANFGVPQHRKRVIGIASLGSDPVFPEPTHSAYGAPGAHLAGRFLPLAPTIVEGLKGLPAEANGTPSDHNARALSGISLQRAEALLPGQTMRDLPEDLRHASYTRRASRRVMDGTPTERRGGSPAGLRRLDPATPSKAITAAATGEFLHPQYDRPLTLRECARLQTFPDDFEFKGTSADRAVLIGNAVPPTLASALGRALVASPIGEDKPGQLLSFIPTLSWAMSPALAAVTKAVEKRYFVETSEEVAKELVLWR